MSGLKLNPALKYTLAQNIFHFSQNVVSYRNETSPEEKCNIFGEIVTFSTLSQENGDH